MIFLFASPSLEFVLTFFIHLELKQVEVIELSRALASVPTQVVTYCWHLSPLRLRTLVLLNESLLRTKVRWWCRCRRLFGGRPAPMPRPLWCRGSGSGLEASLARVAWTRSVYSEVLDMKAGAVCPDLSDDSWTASHLSTSVWMERDRCDFALRCPLIGGQQPSLTVMLDLWMKPLPHCKETTRGTPRFWLLFFM